MGELFDVGVGRGSMERIERQGASDVGHVHGLDAQALAVEVARCALVDLSGRICDDGCAAQAQPVGVARGLAGAGGGHQGQVLERVLGREPDATVEAEAAVPA